MSESKKLKAGHDIRQVVPDPQEAMAEAKTHPLRGIITTVVKIALAAGLIYWMIQKGVLNFGSIVSLATPGMILFCLGCVFAQIFINNYRWILLMRAQGMETTVGYTLPLSFIGMFFNFFMPGGVGGDVVKGYYVLQDYPQNKVAAAISIFMDRMVGFFIMIATAFLAVFFNWGSVSHSPQLQSVGVGVSLLFAGFVAFFTLALSRRLGKRLFDAWLGELVFVKLPGGDKLRRVYDVVHGFRQHPKLFFWACFLSVGNQMLLVAFTAVIGLAMNVDIPLSVYFFLVPIGMVATALPISPAGVGVGQAAFLFLFNMYLGKESQFGPTAMTVMQATNVAMGVVGAFFYFVRKKPAAMTAA